MKDLNANVTSHRLMLLVLPSGRALVELMYLLTHNDSSFGSSALLSKGFLLGKPITVSPLGFVVKMCRGGRMKEVSWKDYTLRTQLQEG